eukprot:2215282-Rhodomonas_salina.2
MASIAESEATDDTWHSSEHLRIDELEGAAVERTAHGDDGRLLHELDQAVLRGGWEEDVLSEKRTVCSEWSRGSVVPGHAPQSLQCHAPSKFPLAATASRGTQAP